MFFFRFPSIRITELIVMHIAYSTIAPSRRKGIKTTFRPEIVFLKFLSVIYRIICEEWIKLWECVLYVKIIINISFVVIRLIYSVMNKIRNNVFVALMTGL